MDRVAGKQHTSGHGKGSVQSGHSQGYPREQQTTQRVKEHVAHVKPPRLQSSQPVVQPVDKPMQPLPQRLLLHLQNPQTTARQVFYNQVKGNNFKYKFFYSNL